MRKFEGMLIDKNALRHTAKHLGYFNHILKVSQLHQSEQGMLSNMFSIKELCISSFLFFQKSYLATFHGITSATMHLSRGRCLKSKNNKPHQKC